MKHAKLIIVGLLVTGMLVVVGPAFAHAPICNCYDNGDETVTCEGGFSDGGSAEGVPIRILDLRDRVLIDGKMETDSTYSFTKPDEAFHIVFDAGDSHIVTIYDEDIE
jgi:hypothetical protein